MHEYTITTIHNYRRTGQERTHKGTDQTSDSQQDSDAFLIFTFEQKTPRETCEIQTTGGDTTNTTKQQKISTQAPNTSQELMEKNKSSLNMVPTTPALMQSTVEFYDLSISGEEISTDESLMTIVCASMKSLLKSTTHMFIQPPDHEDILPVITHTNSMLPKSVDTKLIRQYINKGNTYGNYVLVSLKRKVVGQATFLQRRKCKNYS